MSRYIKKLKPENKKVNSITVFLSNSELELLKSINQSNSKAVHKLLEDYKNNLNAINN